jgi:hypothetical protein
MVIPRRRFFHSQLNTTNQSIMRFSAAAIIIALGFASAYVVEPPTTADPATDPTCYNWAVAEENDDCVYMCNRHSQSVWFFTIIVSSPL